MNIDRAFSQDQKETSMKTTSPKELTLSLAEAKQNEKTHLCVDIDDCLWLHSDSGRPTLNSHLLKIIATHHALGRKTTLITNRSEVSVFEEAIKCKMSGQPLKERTTTALFEQLQAKGFGYLTKDVCFKYTPHLYDEKMQPTHEHIARHEKKHTNLIEKEFKTTRWKAIRNDEKLIMLEGGKFTSRTKGQLLTDLLRKRIKPNTDQSDPEKNLREAYVTFASRLEGASNASFPDLTKALSREHSADIVTPVIRDLYKVIFENCARAHFSKDFQCYDAIAPKARKKEFTVNGHRIFGRDKVFSVRYLQALANQPSARCVLIDDNWKYVCSALHEAGMEYVHINPKNPALACTQLMKGLMTEKDQRRAQEIIDSKKSFPTRCQESLFSTKGAVAVGVATLGIGIAVYQMRNR